VVFAVGLNGARGHGSGARFIRAMFVIGIGISFRQTARHSPSTLTLPQDATSSGYRHDLRVV
jgi:hypothetical protein